MAGERVPSLLLRAGDVIRICHRHDLEFGKCLSLWDIDAVVTEDPAPVGDMIGVKWAEGGRLLAGRSAVTGISMFRPGEQILRIGRAPAARPA